MELLPRKQVARKKVEVSFRNSEWQQQNLGQRREADGDTQIHSSANHNPNHGLLVGRENTTTSSPKNKLGDHGEKRLVLGDKLIALTSLQCNFWFR